MAAHDALAADGPAFLLDYCPGEDWQTYLDRLRDESRGLDLPDDRVPATFLAASVGGVLVGRISIRHELNDDLAGHGGHIGYGVTPEHRRRGYATAMLGQGLIVARSHGVDSVFISCDDDNAGSVRVIERNGGILDSVVAGAGGAVATRRYMIH